MIVAHENESESLREARLADDVERLIVAHSKLSIRFKLLFSNYYLAIFLQSRPISQAFSSDVIR